MGLLVKIRDWINEPAQGSDRKKRLFLFWFMAGVVPALIITIIVGQIAIISRIQWLILTLPIYPIIWIVFITIINMQYLKK